MSKAENYAIIQVTGSARHPLAEIAKALLALDALHRELAFLERLSGLAEISPKLVRGLIRERSDSPSPRSLQSQLVFHGANFNSPGIWEFLGKLNPLEVIREFLNDLHERRKDREYRESTEKRRLEIENALLENKVIKGRIEILKSLGLSESELGLLRSRLLQPMGRVAEASEEALLGSAEIIEFDLVDDSEVSASVEHASEAVAQHSYPAESVTDQVESILIEDEEDEEDEMQEMVAGA